MLHKIAVEKVDLVSIAKSHDANSFTRLIIDDLFFGFYRRLNTRTILCDRYYKRILSTEIYKCINLYNLSRINVKLKKKIHNCITVRKKIKYVTLKYISNCI